jgi:cysteine desulfurase
MIYLDWASTTPPDASMLSEAAALAAEFYGNPSSRHGLGQAARKEFEAARARIASSLASAPTSASSRPPAKANPQLVFTSGGSEADAMVLLALLRRKDSRSSAPPHLVTTSIEHSAIFEQAKLLEGLGIPVTFVAPEADGRILPERVGAAIRKETALVAVMAVNNETGAVQPLAEIAEAIRAASLALGRQEPPFFHSDAVQALGKIPFAPASLGLSSAAFSAHKIRGPRGSGAFWLRGRLDPLVLGGGQEGGLRPGTENLQGAWAFARAAETAAASLEERRRRALALESRLIAGLGAIPGALPLPLGRRPGDPRYSPFILSAAFPGLSGEVLERALSDEGIAVSTGSACSSHQRGKGRRVLDAMGLEAGLSFSAIRVSTGDLTTEAEIDRFLEVAGKLYGILRT